MSGTLGNRSACPDSPLELEGRFWDPALPQRAVRGRLTWGDTPSLALEDVLHPAERDKDPLEQITDAGRDRAELIAGRTVFGEPLW